MACHGQSNTTEGEVDLFTLRTAADIVARPELIDNLITVIGAGYLPPEDEAPLESVNRRRIVNLWCYGVHGPWGHKPEYTKYFAAKKDPSGRQGNPIMASMLKSVDECFGRILDELDDEYAAARR